MDNQSFDNQNNQTYNTQNNQNNQLIDYDQTIIIHKTEVQKAISILNTYADLAQTLSINSDQTQELKRDLSNILTNITKFYRKLQTALNATVTIESHVEAIYDNQTRILNELEIIKNMIQSGGAINSEPNNTNNNTVPTNTPNNTVPTNTIPTNIPNNTTPNNTIPNNTVPNDRPKLTWAYY